MVQEITTEETRLIRATCVSFIGWGLISMALSLCVTSLPFLAFLGMPPITLKDQLIVAGILAALGVVMTIPALIVIARSIQAIKKPQ
jgi:hypothetical protein